MQLSHFLKTYNFPTRAVRNLGTFNTSYMSPNAQDVFFNYACVNAVDSHAYPELTLIKKYCADFLLEDNFLIMAEKSLFDIFLFFSFPLQFFMPG